MMSESQKNFCDGFLLKICQYFTFLAKNPMNMQCSCLFVRLFVCLMVGRGVCLFVFILVLAADYERK